MYSPKNWFASPYRSLTSSAEYEYEGSFNTPKIDVNLIAFYLPQYHPIEENDRFWGKGFTEWNNVTRALPLFKGHYQPNLPGELGFYDLRIKDTIKRQIELARKYGVNGFCFHYYFFENKSILRRPLDLFLSDKDLEISFCINWANEPWTTRWDGNNKRNGILIDQTHSPKENIEFIKSVIPAFQDYRYIRVENKPLLLIYRPGLFDDFRKTVDLWRNYCALNGIGDIYLTLVQTLFDPMINPDIYGCDAAVEFPPHLVNNVSVSEKIQLLHRGFKGNIFSYREVMKHSINMVKPSYKLFRGIIPRWDNTPRKSNATIYFGASPQVYGQWLKELALQTIKNNSKEERFIFINAWNEWAEGAYLEPDRRYGYAYLNATAISLIEAANSLKIN